MKTNKDISEIFRYLKPYKKTVRVIVILTILSAAISSFIPIIYGRLVDLAILPGSSLKIIFGLLLLWLLMRSLADWFSRIADDKGWHLSYLVSHDLTLEIGSHLLNLPLSFHKDKRMGEELNKLNRADGAIWHIIHESVLQILPNILIVLVVTVLMLLLNWYLTLLLAVILIIYAIVSITKNQEIVPQYKKFNKKEDAAYGYIWDATLNIQVVKSNVNEDHETRRYKKVFTELYEAASQIMPYWRSMAAWQQTMMGLGFVIVFGAAVLALKAGDLSPGEIVTFVGFINLLVGPFNQIGQLYRMLRRQITAIKRALELTAVKPENYNQATGLERQANKGLGLIEFKKVSFRYRQNWVLENINLQVKPGQVVALVGESGVGKSTFVDLISRYIEPTKGTILLDKINTKNYTLKSLRDLMAVVPQEVTLFNDTVANNIHYGRPAASPQAIKQAAQAANALEFIDNLPKGFKTLVGERGIKLSVGQKQRIAIARAVLRNPEILILDEATSALDSKTEQQVQQALEKLITGRTTFIIAHRLSTIRHADLILVLANGHIAEQGTHSELLKKKDGLYSELYNLQHAYF